MRLTNTIIGCAIWPDLPKNANTTQLKTYSVVLHIDSMQAFEICIHLWLSLNNACYIHLAAAKH